MNITLLFLMPVVSALAGWILFRIALYLLFRPMEPVKFPGVKLQGLLPARKQEIGEKLGKFAAQELTASMDIGEKIANPAVIEKILPLVEGHIDSFLHERLPKAFPMLSMFIGEKTIRTMKEAIMSELQTLFPELLRNYAGLMLQELDLENLIRQRVDQLSPGKLESMLRKGLSKEFRRIEILGAVFGLLIGLLQVLITVILR